MNDLARLGIVFFQIRIKLMGQFILLPHQLQLILQFLCLGNIMPEIKTIQIDHQHQRTVYD